MKIAVLVKEVPDTYGDRRLDLATGLADRAGGEAVLDEICERALEVALRHADDNDGVEVVAVSMGPAAASASVRKALSMGATSAVHIADAALAGADLGLTAQVLAAAVAELAPDLVIAGNRSTDGSGGVLPAMIAEHLDYPDALSLSTVTIDSGRVGGDREIEGGVQRVSAELPAVISITESLPEARFPTFKGIMGAKKKPLLPRTAAELGVAVDDESVPRSIVLAVEERPAREAGIRLVDDGDAGVQLAEFLLRNKLV
jgi:electron transfer flavoprotein beta subunit